MSVVISGSEDPNVHTSNNKVFAVLEMVDSNHQTVC